MWSPLNGGMSVTCWLWMLLSLLVLLMFQTLTQFSKVKGTHSHIPTIYNAVLKHRLEPRMLSRDTVLSQHVDNLLLFAPAEEQCLTMSGSLNMLELRATESAWRIFIMKKLCYPWPRKTAVSETHCSHPIYSKAPDKETALIDLQLTTYSQTFLPNYSALEKPLKAMTASSEPCPLQWTFKATGFWWLEGYSPTATLFLSMGLNKFFCFKLCVINQGRHPSTCARFLIFCLHWIVGQQGCSHVSAQLCSSSVKRHCGLLSTDPLGFSFAGAENHSLVSCPPTCQIVGFAVCSVSATLVCSPLSCLDLYLLSGGCAAVRYPASLCNCHVWMHCKHKVKWFFSLRHRAVTASTAATVNIIGLSFQFSLNCKPIRPQFSGTLWGRAAFPTSSGGVWMSLEGKTCFPCLPKTLLPSFR